MIKKKVKLTVPLTQISLYIGHVEVHMIPKTGGRNNYEKKPYDLINIKMKASAGFISQKYITLVKS